MGGPLDVKSAAIEAHLAILDHIAQLVEEGVLFLAQSARVDHRVGAFGHRER